MTFYAYFLCHYCLLIYSGKYELQTEKEREADPLISLTPRLKNNLLQGRCSILHIVLLKLVDRI